MVAPLHRADGSATYTANDYTIIAAVNGPLEVQRRDELPEDAAIEVHIRPAVGTGSTRERDLEGILHATLKRIILTRKFPRTLIQVTLQIISMPETSPSLPSNVSSTSGHKSLPLLPALLQSSLLALLSAAVPLETTYATISKQLPSSYHVFTFSGAGQLLVSESEGSFALEEWEGAYDAAEGECRGAIEKLRAEWTR